MIDAVLVVIGADAELTTEAVLFIDELTECLTVLDGRLLIECLTDELIVLLTDELTERLTVDGFELLTDELT